MTPKLKEVGRRTPSLAISGLPATVKLAQWWKPKASNLLAVLYSVILITGLPVSRALFLLIPSLVTMFGIGSFGHVLNDWFDIDADARAAKPNRMRGMKRELRFGLLLGVAAIGLLPWMVLPFDTLSVALLISEFALLSAYAVPPVRLKERRIWPILADAAYAYAIPAVLAAHTFFLAGRRPDDLIPPRFAIRLAIHPGRTTFPESPGARSQQRHRHRNANPGNSQRQSTYP